MRLPGVGECRSLFQLPECRASSSIAVGHAIELDCACARPRSYLTGGGVPSALSASDWSQPQTMHECRNTERANSSATVSGSGLRRTSSQARMYSPKASFHLASGVDSEALAKLVGAG